MTKLPYTDHRADPSAWARTLGISPEAVEVYLASDVIDLHIDTFIWDRVLRYDMRRRHGPGLLGARYYSQVDLPRVREAAISGAIWAITTNPLRARRGRARAFRRNRQRLRRILASVSEDVQLVRCARDYRAAREAGKHAAWIGIQGGNAVDAPQALALLDEDIVQVTLVHLSSSSLGRTSSPLARGRDEGLSALGRDYVAALDEKRIFVDLAHVSERGFFDAVDAHDPSLPLIATHTGVDGATPSWRNLSDAQLRAVADTGGTVGVIYHSSFLGDGYWAGGRAASIVEHLAHIVATVGEDHASLGSDWDGAIITPRDMPTCLELPRLVQLMLDRGWRPERIGKILGGNFLRALEALRG